MFFVQLCLRPGMGQPSNVLGQPGNDYVDKVKDEGKYFFVFFSLFSGLPGPLGVLSITRPVLSRSDRVLDFHAAWAPLRDVKAFVPLPQGGSQEVQKVFPPFFFFFLLYDTVQAGWQHLPAALHRWVRVPLANNSKILPSLDWGQKRVRLPHLCSQPSQQASLLSHLWWNPPKAIDPDKEGECSEQQLNCF